MNEVGSSSGDDKPLSTSVSNVPVSSRTPLLTILEQYLPLWIWELICLEQNGGVWQLLQNIQGNALGEQAGSPGLSIF